jgi:hypothetical protein
MFDSPRRAQRRLGRYLRPFPADDAVTRSASVRDGLMPPAGRDPQWPAAAAALLASSPDPRAAHVASRVEVPATPVPMPPVLVLGDDIRVDHVQGDIAGTRVVLITAGDSRILLTLRVTADAAEALVCGLIPAAAASLRLIDNVLDGLGQQVRS